MLFWYFSFTKQKAFVTNPWALFPFVMAPETRGKKDAIHSNPDESDSDDIRSTLQSIRDELRKGLKDTNFKLSEVVKFHTFLSEKYDEISVSLESVIELKKKVETLEINLEEKDKEIQELQRSLQQNEQYMRRNQIEVGGVEESEGENVEEIVINVARKLQIQLSPTDFQASHRIPSRTSPAPIIVEFTNRKTKEALLNSKRKMFLKDDVGRKIYLNESLTPFFKNLLWQSKNLAKEHGMKFCWFKNHKIFLKRSENSNQVYKIMTLKDLLTLKEKLKN